MKWDPLLQERPVALWADFQGLCAQGQGSSRHHEGIRIRVLAFLKRGTWLTLGLSISISLKSRLIGGESCGSLFLLCALGWKHTRSTPSHSFSSIVVIPCLLNTTNMLFTKVAFAISSLAVLTAAQDADASSKGISPGRGRTPNPTSSKLMFKRDLNKRCTGSCEECFGSGYTLCPGSEIFCYLPGDASYGLDSCTSDGSGSDTTPTASASAPASTSTSSSTGIDDLCSQVGATCVSCFGPTYLECSDGYHCYDPNDPNYDTCPDNSTSSGGSSSGGSSGGATTTSSCAAEWGEGNIPCGTDGCYDPTIGESCCAGGCKS